MTDLEYEMDVTTLPVHYFTEMTAFEITNRMDCLINNGPESCMRYCETITEIVNLKSSDTEDCYKHYRVPGELYGLAICNSLFPSISMSAEVSRTYLICLSLKNVTLDTKLVCKYRNYGNDELIF